MKNYNIEITELLLKRVDLSLEEALNEYESENIVLNESDFYERFILNTDTEKINYNKLKSKDINKSVIIEILSRLVSINADSLAAAKKKVQELIDNESIVLDYSNFIESIIL